MFGLFDLTDHQLTTVGTWAEVAILLFMVWENYGPKLLGGGMNAPAVTVPSHGLLGGLRENRTLVLAIIGLAIVAWLHFRESTPTMSFTQEQVNDKVADAKKLLTSQLEETASLKAQINDANEKLQNLRQNTTRQIADAVAKATAPLQGQIAQLQSDAPISVEKLPTSLKLLFKGGDIEEIASQNVIWTKVVAWHEQNVATLLGEKTNTIPVWAIVLVFKKPIIFKELHSDDHGAGLPLPEKSSSGPRYAVIEFGTHIAHYSYQNVLVDITVTN